MKKILFIFVLIFSSFVKADITPISETQESALNEKFNRILATHKVNTIGIALIKSGNMQWSGYYGEQSPGVPATEETLFNVGSITKTVVTQTVLQLVKEQVISLDKPMFDYWVIIDCMGNIYQQIYS